ncbi:Phosphate acetyltransferase [Corynebacterium ciconiae DSM 44920]|nr:phosphate acetyltransferase [Corynebacterium ciconiae]WKD62006.1 Phosphate acetyltransferase [Corynebacterium ciconiae DSM 44920]
MTAVLLSALGVNLATYDPTPLAQHLNAKPQALIDATPQLSTVLGTSYPEDALLVGTGDIDFDARAAAGLGVPLLLLADAPDSTIELATQKAAAHFAPVAAVIAPGEESSINKEELGAREPVMSPELFEHSLLEQAKAIGARIVLPEGEDDRVLQAASQLLAAGVCELTILGDPEDISARAAAEGLDLSRAELVDPLSSVRAEDYAAEFARLRANKGVTIEQAREQMKDVSYFATMMVHCGDADGMVSGAAHTTAETIRPALQIIKTTPDASVVSSVFFMVLPGRIWAVGDCAVNLNPTAEQLGEIAAISARTARQFGLDPKVAVLSYSTGSSGAGPDVDRAIAAVDAARAIEPELRIDGPLQFDAAVTHSVAAKKAPDSPVAGSANVLIFPDLEAGNIGYKAIQRTAGALAVGPVLQGLNAPVNDLSRGATVPDIVNTVAITAIQTGGNR